ncbi:MAG: flagellar hook-basal body protein [Phycisphaerae bacterium]
MVYGLWLSADGLLGQQYRQDVIANNLANVDTPGFRPDRVAFAERLTESISRVSVRTRHPVLDAATGGLFETPVYTDFSVQANLIASSSPFDVAILDGGFLTVQTADGPRYTLDGRLTMDRDGTLRHAASGGAVVDARGKPILLDPAAAGDTRIDASGRVFQGDTRVGELALVGFEDRQRLEKVGRNLYDGQHANLIRSQGSVRQFAYEASAVDAAATLVDMMAATRAYEMNASMITMQDESLGRLVNDVGRIG